MTDWRRGTLYRFPDGEPVYLLTDYDAEAKADVLGPPYFVAIENGGYQGPSRRKANLRETIAGLEQEILRVSEAGKATRKSLLDEIQAVHAQHAREHVEDRQEIATVDARQRRMMLVLLEALAADGDECRCKGGIINRGPCWHTLAWAELRTQGLETQVQRREARQILRASLLALLPSVAP